MVAILISQPLCRHCERPKVSRPRGLCWTCYYTPGVKALYPSTSKYAHRGVGGGNRHRPLPATPTTAAPCTPEKLAVFQERIAAGQSLFHPEDARYEGDARPLAWLMANAC